MKKFKNIFISAMMMITLLGTSVVVSANDSPSKDVATDSEDIIVEAADTSNQDVLDLVEGKSPSEVVGDAELEGFSTYGVYSIVPVLGYEFSSDQTVSFKVAGITSDMGLKVMMLENDGAWYNIPFSVNDGEIFLQLTQGGQVAIFVDQTIEVEVVEDAAAKDTTKKTNASPKTEDPILYVVILASAAGTLVIMTKKKIHR